MKFFSFVLQPIIYLAIGLNFLFCIVPISLLALPFSQRIRLKMTAPFWKLFFRLSIYAIILARVTKIDERDEFAKKNILPKGLYIANHQSFIDIPLVFSNFIIPPIMKKSLLYIPVFGICAYSSGAILVDRKDRKSRKKVFQIAAKRLMEGEKQLQYYPEGTRSLDAKPKNYTEIQTSLIRFAFDKNIKVYPVSIYGTKAVVQDKLIIPGKKLGIHLHAAVEPKDFQSKEEFSKACWNKVVEGHTALELQIN